MTRIILILFALGISIQSLIGQELNCNVTINADRVTGAEPRIFKTLETSVREFMNNRNWTNDVFSIEERIECSIFMTINSELGNNRYTASATIQASRPAYNSNYNTTMLNLQDNDIVFKYEEFDPIEFQENQYVSNLSHILAFYAYLFLALDYDSFSPLGGDKYLSKAWEIVNTVPQVGSEPGWKPFDGTNNRYWVVENLQNNRYQKFRDSWYTYHREGIDLLYSDKKTAIQNIAAALKDLTEVERNNPNSYIMQLYTFAKGDEIVGIFKGSDLNTRRDVYQYMINIDKTNQKRYEDILRN
jgi:hypothetical protein